MIYQKIFNINHILKKININLDTNNKCKLAWTMRDIWYENNYLLVIKKDTENNIDKIAHLSKKKKIVLNLIECNNITDVSMLGNVHNPHLTWCEKIMDISVIG